ncbi:tyramine receptor Ser-2-like [Physella acuta]|uniref:tyramine receptor Ser-2-like n=1 Tax=Physella acuta TaxID=109671 RepID=UPI0027DC8744|nr:tyramine receptor Ser-2-like [Physella acuta]
MADYDRISDNPNIVFVFAMVAILITVFTVFANGVVITAVVYAHVQRKHNGQTNKVKRSTAAMLLMTSMSVVDFVVGLVVMPLYIPDLITNGENILDFSWNCARYVLDVNFCTVSIYHVVVMATDRYLAVCKPLVYKALPPKVTWVMLALCWTLPTLIYLLFLSIDAMSGETTNNSTTSAQSCERSSSLATKISMGVLANLPMSFVYVLYFLILLEVYRFNSRRKHFFGFNQSNQKESKQNEDSFNPKSPINKITKNHVGKNVVLNTQRSLCTSTYIKSNSGETCGIQKIPTNTESDIEHSDLCCHKASRNKEDVGRDGCKDEDVSHVGCKGEENVSRAEEDAIDDKFMNGEDVSGNCCKNGEDIQHKDIKKETLGHRKSVRAPAGGSTSSLRAVKTIGEIVLCFSLCWLPLAFYYLIKSFYDIHLPLGTYLALSFLGFLNSAINPVLLYNNLSIRASVMSLIFPATKIKP